MSRPYCVSESQKQQFAGIFALRTIEDNGGRIPLLLEDNDAHLEPLLDWLHNRGHLEIVDDQHYSVSAKGREALALHQARYVEFLRTFDVYSAVDLEVGRFAFERMFEFEAEGDWQNYLDDDIWDDLRVAVAEFKRIDPLEMVFLSFVNEDLLRSTPDWQAAIMGDSVWQEIEEICNNAIHIEDLGYDDDDEGPVDGQEVLKEIIRAGAELNLELKKQERELEAAQSDQEEDSLTEAVVEEYYQPYYDPFYVSPVWMAMWLL